MARIGEISRETKETRIRVRLDLDGTGVAQVSTGVGFFDHMLDALARHGGFDLQVEAEGDLHIDDHHTVEDVGIVIGQAFRQACDGFKGVRRYGAAYVPFDETLVRCAVDLSNRPFLVWSCPFPTPKIGTFDTELVREFHQAFSGNGGVCLHLDLLHGVNSHHIAEAAFKATARALRQAVEIDPKAGGAAVSTKGVL